MVWWPSNLGCIPLRYPIDVFRHFFQVGEGVRGGGGGKVVWGEGRWQYL